MTTITGAADDESRVACVASLLPYLAPFRHPARQVGLDKDDGSWHGKTIRLLNLMATSYEVAKLGSRRWSGGIPGSFSTFQNNLHHQRKF